MIASSIKSGPYFIIESANLRQPDMD